MKTEPHNNPPHSVLTVRFHLTDGSVHSFQQQLFPAELSLARTQRDQLLAVVALYKALGGGWQDEMNRKQHN